MTEVRPARARFISDSVTKRMADSKAITEKEAQKAELEAPRAGEGARVLGDVCNRPTVLSYDETATSVSLAIRNAVVYECT